jgi:hypothetical protein
MNSHLPGPSLLTLPTARIGRLDDLWLMVAHHLEADPGARPLAAVRAADLGWQPDDGVLLADPAARRCRPVMPAGSKDRPGLVW